MKRRRQRGQALLESALTLLLFLGILIGILDFGQVLFTHQLMVERVRSGARWGSLRAWDGTGDQVANMILYNSPSAPMGVSKGFLGMNRSNISVQYRDGSAGEPNDASLSVAIINYDFHLVSPWIAKTFRKSFAASETVAMQYKP